MKKYEENRKNYEGNMKKYVGNMKKYEQDSGGSDELHPLHWLWDLEKFRALPP